jgi:hypothetical protein
MGVSMLQGRERLMFLNNIQRIAEALEQIVKLLKEGKKS